MASGQRLDCHDLGSRPLKLKHIAMASACAPHRPQVERASQGAGRKGSTVRAPGQGRDGMQVLDLSATTVMVSWSMHAWPMLAANSGKLLRNASKIAHCENISQQSATC